MKDNEYKCDECGGVFQKGQTDKEAIEEMEENGWGNMEMEEMAVVCDDCYNKIMLTIN